MPQTIPALTSDSNPSASTSLRCPTKTLLGRWRQRLRPPLSAILASAFFPVLAPAATLTWTNELGGNWSVPENWSPNQVPGNGDQVVIHQAGTYTVTVTTPLTVGSLELGAATGPGTQTLNLNGFTLNLISDSTIQPSGLLRLAAGGNALVCSAITLINEGKVVWNSGTVYGGAGGTIRNRGLWEAQGDHLLTWGTVGLPFHNTGVFRKSAGSGTTTLEANFINTGTLEVQSGTVALINGGTNDTPGAFNTTQGSVLTFRNGYTFNSGSRFEGSGEPRLLTGNFNINGDLTATGLSFRGGTVGGTHVLHGQFNLAGGNWQTAGTTTLASDGRMEITDNLVFPFRSWVNEGVILWKGGSITSGAGGEIRNHGTWEAQGDHVLTWTTVGLPFHNMGMFRKSAGSGTTTLEANFINTGTLEVQSGTVALINGGTNDTPGEFTIAEGTALTFNSGYTFNSGSRFDGLGEARLLTGNFNINGDLTATGLSFRGGTVEGTHVLHGQFNLAGGNWQTAGTTTLASDGRMEITDNLVFPFRSWVNEGVVLWKGGSITSGAGGEIRNHGTWEAQGDHVLAWTTVGLPFHNMGMFRKSAGSGTTTLEANFINTGTLEVQSGTVALINGGTNDTPGEFTIAEGTALTFNSGYTFNSGSRFDGLGEARLVNGNFTVNGELTAPNLSFRGGLVGGTHVLNGQFNLAGANWQTSGTTTLASGSSAQITGNTPLSFRSLTNHGSIFWRDGVITIGGGGTVQNHGLWEALGDNLLTTVTDGSSFVNRGTFRKSSSNGTTTLEAALSNSGLLDIQSGTLAQTYGGRRLEGGKIQFGIRGVSDFGKLSLPGGSALAGSFSATLLRLAQ